MANVKMVTRSVIGTHAKVMIVDLVNGTTSIQELNVSGKLTDKEKVLKAVQKIADNETQKVVAVQEFSNFNTLYGMPETMFMELAQPLPELEAKREEYAQNKAKKAQEQK